ncbi:MAG: adenosylcobinamide-GDP ribazoletransferase [Spirochaetaceae bacterium]|jgi:adenosylcobinamide-GDP ribazoletransferase|nr:adenosylcobinamide-GDP ribazoletransferase [Spirochaetaceae bacterium]
MFDRFLSVLSLVSRFPVKVRFRFDVSRMDFYLPVIGLFPAVLGAAVYFAALYLSGLKLFAAAAAVFVQYLGFNLFHLDGLADTADAFLGWQSRERRFEILEDSRIGVYGLFAGISAPAFKLLLLYGVLGGGNGMTYTDLLVFIYPVSGRFAAALIPCTTAPARPDGLGALAAGSCLRWALTGALAALLAGLAAAGAAAPVLTEAAVDWDVFVIVQYFALPLLAGLVSAAFYAGVYRKGLGGYSGDALGAAIETGEALCLLFAAIAFNMKVR